MAVPDSSILLAKPAKDILAEKEFNKVIFACLPENWRVKADPNQAIVTKGEMLGYLNPAAVIRQVSPPVRPARRVIDHPEFSLFVSS